MIPTYLIAACERGFRGNITDVAADALSAAPMRAIVVKRAYG